MLIRKISAALLMTAALSGAAFAQTSASSSPTTHTITIKNFGFDPADLTVNVGDTIEWKNTDVYTHTATTTKDASNSAQFDSGNIRKDGTYRYVVKAKGTYNYYCTYHPNMKAKLEVK